MRNARVEARQRVDGQYDVRVLEPSPAAVTDPPWFADDPLEGGDVLPIARAGGRTWEEVAEGDAELRAWCEDRWLIGKPLAPLTPAFVDTRIALHRLAEDVMAPARQAVNGKIGLRFTYRGFGTPFFGDDRQLRVEDGVLVDENDSRSDVAGVDVAAARALGDWYGYCASLLEQLRAEADAAGDGPARVQLWPEHFDLAVDMGDKEAGKRANFGGSPGDEDHPEPYLYVGPWGPYDPDAGDGFWNESFGASLGYAALLDGADGLAFLRRGRALLA